MARKVFINKGKPNQRLIGEIDKVYKIFTKKVFKDLHLFRKLNAYGIDSRYFNSHLNKDNYMIKVIEMDTGMIYKCHAKDFVENGQYFHFKQEKEDHNTQIFLPLKFWQSEDTKTFEYQQKHIIYK